MAFNATWWRLVALLVGAAVFSACPPPVTVGQIGYFRANPLDILPGESTQLSWSATNADGCELSPDVGAVPAEGVALVTPAATTEYVLTCNGGLARIKVVVRPNTTINSFTASASTVTADAHVDLTWSTTSATSCELSGVGPVDPNGTVNVSVAQTTTYTLRCAGVGPDASATTTVTVMMTSSLDAPTSLALTPGDGTLTLTWQQTAGSANVYLAEAGGITVANIDTLPGRVVFRRVASPYTVAGLVNGRTYFVRVSAVSGALESSLTPEQSAAPVGVEQPDPYFAEQWHLTNPQGEDVDALPVWAQGLKGEGVKVAVVDEGVDLGHEDLKQNVATGMSYDYLRNAPLALAEHGTCVAGLIAARDLNGVGLRGVAPRANLRSFNVLQNLTSANEYDAMTRGMSEVALSNNSWGDAWDSTGLLTAADPQWLRGVQEGATQGRGGKGVIYFWAAGNGADPADGPVDDSNFDGQANSRFVLAVGGVGRDGTHVTYAEGGANVLIVAPTMGDDGVGLVTTDITGTAGYNRGNDPAEHPNANYSSTMSGTSGSTPVALGVAALVLQARPELSYRDMRRVLALSARKAQGGDPGWATNTAGLHVHHQFGFGVVDANAAVTLARTIPLVGPELSFTSPLQSPNLAIPDNNTTGVSSSVVVSNSGIGHTEVIEVEVTVLPHQRSGDLEISLNKAGSVVDVLHPPHGCLDPETNARTCSDLDGFTFTTVRHLDEPADGTYTLTVRDRRSGNTGTFASWKLRLFGRQ